MSIESMEGGNRYIKRTLKTRVLLGIDKFLRLLYPDKLNEWIFDNIDHYTVEETEQIREKWRIGNE